MSTDKFGRELRKRLVNELDLLGVTDYRIEDTNGGHRRLVATVSTKQVKLIFSRTPSDRRAMIAAVTMLRRLIRQARQA